MKRIGWMITGKGTLAGPNDVKDAVYLFSKKKTAIEFRQRIEDAVGTRYEVQKVVFELHTNAPEGE